MASNKNFRSKMSRVENLLLIVNTEVDLAIKLLHYLKQHSFEMVETLRKITSSSIFLKEFLEINSLLLKYLNLLTEINCKFEILEIFNKKESNIASFQNSTLAKNVGFKLHKSGSVNAKTSLMTSTVSTKNITLDQVSDISNFNSSETFCAGKVSAQNNSDKFQMVQNKMLITDKAMEDNKMNKKPQSSDFCVDKKQIVCDGIQLQSTKSVSDDNVEEIADNKNEKDLCIFSPGINEDAGFDQKSFLNEPRKNCALNKFQSEIPSASLKAPVNAVSGKKLCNSTADLKAKDSEDFNSSLTSDVCFNFDLTGQWEGCNDKLYEIKPVNISRKVGEEFMVIVEHIVSPSEFYVYILQSNLYLFTELEKKLRLVEKESSLLKKKESKDYLSQIFGKYVLYYSKCDEKWCRAKVTDWRVNNNDDLVYIYLLDYGESKCVTLHDIQAMPDCFKLYPAFVQRCHLFGIYPTEVNFSSKTLCWSKAASEKMKCLIETSKSLKIRVAPEDTYHPMKSLPVTLWLLDQGDTSVNDLLVKSQQAQSSEKLGFSKSRICENENLEKWNPMKEDYESYMNSYDLDIKDPAAVIYGYVGKDYERICRHFAKTGKCFKGESCKKEHVPLNPSGFTTDKEEVYKNAVNSLPLPPPKSLVSVQVTCILSLNLFCCIRDESAWNNEEETLQSLVQYMNSKDCIRDMKKLLIPPSVGQLVIGKYSQDNSWYRAKILESQPESDQYTVLFVDYGNKERMSLSSIRAIEARYLHLPFQAMQCCIFGITQNPDVPLKDSMDYLNKKLNDGHISVEVVATFPGDHPRLLVHVFNETGENIGNDLINKEYAVFQQELMFSSESTSIPG